MKYYVIYDKETGQIIRYGVCPDEMFDIQSDAEHEDVIQGHNDIRPDTHKVNLKTKQIEEVGKCES